MRVAISSTGKSLESAVDRNFGRCSYFIIYDTDTENFKAILNKFSYMNNNAGIQAVQLIKNNNVELVLTNHIGPKAIMLLQRAKIFVSTGIEGTIKKAIENVIEKLVIGKYKLAKKPNVKNYFGLKI